MDFYGIKENAESIRMPESVRQEITKNLQNRKEQTMKRKSIRLAPIAAVLALCLLIPLGASAAGKSGFFQDLFGRGGAIVGTTYNNATQEIAVTAAVEENSITVTARLTQPEALPYRDLEELSLHSWYLADAEGKCLMEGEATQPVSIQGDTITFTIPSAPDAAVLCIESFQGHKKADQPLTISGDWVIGLE